MTDVDKVKVLSFRYASDSDDVSNEMNHKRTEKTADCSHPHKEQQLIYKISDKPPFYLSILFGLQQALISIAHQLTISLLVAEVVCASKDEEMKARLLSSTLFMTGFTTIVQVTLGVRLPVFQGAAVEYLAPLLALSSVDTTFCNADTPTILDQASNATDIEAQREVILHSLQSLQGSLIAAGVIHTLIGATGFAGFLLRFIGPITIVPALLLIGIYMIRASAKFVIVHWGIAVLTCGTALIFSLYLGRKSMPIPVWTREKGFHVVRYPLHQVFSILIGIVVGWLFSLILTATDVLPDDATSPQYLARTDSRSYIISVSSWFNFPYPGQYGAPLFSISAFIACLVATILSILDSIADYYACAKTCNVPPPPSHAVNRGLTVEGACSLLSGAVGCGHATTTYAGNIGAMGLTKVASRHVFVAVGIIYMLFGVIGKFSAVFITIPHPVLGGALITITGVFIGVILSNLEHISLSSSRNLTIIGTSLVVGWMVPYWLETVPDAINTGSTTVDSVLKMCLGNANLAGAVFACLLDNTVPGTDEERGITAWRTVRVASDTEHYEEGLEVYWPLLPKFAKKSRWLKYAPFLPSPAHTSHNYV